MLYIGVHLWYWLKVDSYFWRKANALRCIILVSHFTSFWVNTPWLLCNALYHHEYNWIIGSIGYLKGRRLSEAFSSVVQTDSYIRLFKPPRLSFLKETDIYRVVKILEIQKRFKLLTGTYLSSDIFMHFYKYTKVGDVFFL